MGVPSAPLQSPSPPRLYPHALQLKLYQAFIFSIPILFSIILILLLYLFYLKRRAYNLTAANQRMLPTTTFNSASISFLPSIQSCQMGFKGDIRDVLPTVSFDEDLKEKNSQKVKGQATSHHDKASVDPSEESVRKTKKEIRLERERGMTMGATTTTTSTQAYGEPWYWDNRYSQETGPFDWYQKYASLAPILHLYVPRHHRVLVVGCGNSAFSDGMVEDGYGDVVNIDISTVVIEAMQKKYANLPQLKYMQMDVRDMNAFETCSFDTIVDKGTLDSLLCGRDSRQNAAKMLKEVARVLKDQGVYILITYGAPIYRLRLLRDSFSWTTKLHAIGSSEHMKWELTSPVPLGDDGRSAEDVLGKNDDVHYIYVCVKGSEMPDLKNESTVDG